MPDETGRLSAEDHEKIQKWWLTGPRWKAPVRCPVCQTQKWTVSNYVVEIERHAADQSEEGSMTFPFVMVACNHCAHTLFSTRSRWESFRSTIPTKIKL